MAYGIHTLQKCLLMSGSTVEMMDKGKMVVEDLITHRCNLDALPQLCKDIYEKKVTICKAIYSRGEK